MQQGADRSPRDGGIALRIHVDDLRGPEIARLLDAHLRSLRLLSPPESVHALDLDALRMPRYLESNAFIDGKRPAVAARAAALAAGRAMEGEAARACFPLDRTG